MNQKNGKNTLGLDIIFEDLDPLNYLKNGFQKLKKVKLMTLMQSRLQLQIKIINLMLGWFSLRV